MLYICHIYDIYIHKSPLTTQRYYYFGFQYSYIFLKYKRRKVIYCIYSDVYHFRCSSFISKVLIFFLRSFPLYLKHFFNIYFSAGLLAMKPLSFLSLENVFISPAYLKDIFMRCRILTWQLFSFWLLWLLWEITVNYIFILLVMCHFLWLLSRFLYFLWFSQFDYDGFIWIYSV